jgi:hypothetical protein
LKVKRKRKKERKAAERAALQRKKQEAKEPAVTQKAVKSSQRGRRSALQKSGLKAKKAQVVHTAKGSSRGSKPASAPPLKRTKMCSANLPAQYLDQLKYLQGLVYYFNTSSRDNSYCGLLYSLIFVDRHMVFGKEIAVALGLAWCLVKTPEYQSDANFNMQQLNQYEPNKVQGKGNQLSHTKVSTSTTISVNYLSFELSS